MSREESQWSLAPASTLVINAVRSIRNTFQQNEGRARHSQRGTIKAILKKKTRPKSNIPVLASRLNKMDEKYPTKNGYNCISTSSRESISNSLCKRNKKPKKRKEWMKMPVPLKTAHNSKPNNCSKGKERSKLTMNKIVDPTNKVVSIKGFGIEKDIFEANENNSRRMEVFSKNIVNKRTNINIRPPSKTVLKKEYLRRVSNSSLMALQRIISKKVREFRGEGNNDEEPENEINVKKRQYKNQSNYETSISFTDEYKREHNNPSTSNGKYGSRRNFSKKLKNIAEENKKPFKNVTFKSSKFTMSPPKSRIPTRVLETQTSRSQSTIGSLKLVDSNSLFDTEEINLWEKKPILTVSCTETTSFIPSNISPQISFVEKNKQNIKNIKKPQPKTVAVKENKPTKRKSNPSIRRPGSTATINRRNEYNEVQHSRNVSPTDTLYIVLYVLGNIVRQIPQVIKSICPSFFSTSVDQETYMSRDILFAEEERKRKMSLKKFTRKYETNHKYLPPWEEYKHKKRVYSRNNVTNKPATSCSRRVNDVKKVRVDDNLINELTKIDNKNTYDQQFYIGGVTSQQLINKNIIESKSMEDFYRRVYMGNTKSFCVQVDEPTCTSEQCDTTVVREKSPKKGRKLWKVDYGRSRKRITSGNINFLRMLRAAVNIFVDANSSSDLGTSSSVTNPIKIRKKHIDTDDSMMLYDTTNLPGFCKLWKHAPKHRCKKSDKNLIYSYVASSMPKSSTSFLCPILSDRTNPVIIFNGANANKSTNKSIRRSKRSSKGTSKKKKGHIDKTKPSSSKCVSVPDIFYEAEDSSFFDTTSTFTNVTKTELTENNTAVNGSYPNLISASTTEKPNEFLGLLTGPLWSMKGKLSNYSLYVEDLIGTTDFGCDVSVIAHQDEADMTETKLYRACESQYENIDTDHYQKETVPEKYKKPVILKDDISIDELIGLLKQEFGDENNLSK